MWHLGLDAIRCSPKEPGPQPVFEENPHQVLKALHTAVKRAWTVLSQSSWDILTISNIFKPYVHESLRFRICEDIL